MRVEKDPIPQEFSDYLSLPEDITEVDQGNWMHGEGDYMTISVASCVVIASHNELTNQGLLGHFSAISQRSRLDPGLKREHFDTAKFEEAVEAISSLGPLGSTQLWVGGGAAYQADNSRDEAVMADREYAIRRIGSIMGSYGLSGANVLIDWNTTQYDLAVRLNCSEGVLRVQFIREDD